mmetsp:Transcript_18252/g.50787  ORF Transcript_18252/g.50787 Transcript_18252/m.50787 type:complete len:117 (+) Transcript_18252:507-857(+)
MTCTFVEPIEDGATSIPAILTASRTKSKARVIVAQTVLVNDGYIAPILLSEFCSRRMRCWPYETIYAAATGCGRVRCSHLSCGVEKHFSKHFDSEPPSQRPLLFFFFCDRFGSPSI